MGTHNYSTESYNDNIQILKNSISRINQTILPSDPSSQFSFAYSMEVTSFNRILSDLQEVCTKSTSAYEKAKGKVCVADADSAAKMADPISDLATLTNTLNNITSVMSGTNTGGQVLDFTQCITTVNQLTYEGIVGIDEPDFENMSDEDAKYYYDYYMNIPEDQLTDENRRQIERYLEHLKSKYSIDDNVTEEEKRFIDLYEKIHADEAESMNTFFGKSSQDGITEYDKANIKFIAYTSEGDCHTAFFSCIGYIQDETWSNDGSIDGNEIAHFSPDRKTVFLNLHSDGLNDADGSYTTVFHELGHAIDYNMCSWFDNAEDNEKKSCYMTDMLYFYSVKENLYTALYDDTRNYFTKIVNAYNEKLGQFKLSDESKKKIVEAMLDGRKGWTTLNPYEKAIYDALRDVIELQPGYKNLAVSDIIGGVTNNTVAGQRISVGSLVGTLGTGHKRSYWYDGNSPTNNQSKEFFAEYMSYLMTGQTEKVEKMRQIFPKASEMIEKVLKEGKLEFINNRKSDEQKVQDYFERICN